MNEYNNYIKLFYNELDIKQSNIIKHFLQYLGFYTENGIDNYNEKNPAINIYMISNLFMEKHENIVEDIDMNNSILILKDKYYSESHPEKSIMYSDEMDMETLLYSLIDKINEIINDSYTIDDIWQDEANFIAKNYLKYEIYKYSKLSTVVIDKTIYHNSYKNYRKFISEIEGKDSKFLSDYLNYVLVKSKYEIDYISKINSYEQTYNSKDLLEKCNTLLEKYYNNENLYLLKSDILFELQNNWISANQILGNQEINHSIYAYYKRGIIVKERFGEDNNAFYLLTKAISIYPGYYEAWYRLGEYNYHHYGKDQKDIIRPIDCFKKVLKILNNKYKNGILTPKEYVYFYNSMVDIALIYKIKHGDYITCYEWGYEINNMINDEKLEKYINENWNDENNSEKAYQKIIKQIYVDLDKCY